MATQERLNILEKARNARAQGALGIPGVIDKRALSSARNGLLGGRPKGTHKDAYLYAQEARRRICELVAKDLDGIIEAQIKKALQGDSIAFIALLDRAHGKPAQAIEMQGKDGQPIVFMPLELIQKHALTVASESVAIDKSKVIKTIE